MRCPGARCGASLRWRRQSMVARRWLGAARRWLSDGSQRQLLGAARLWCWGPVGRCGRKRRWGAGAASISCCGLHATRREATHARTPPAGPTACRRSRASRAALRVATAPSPRRRPRPRSASRALPQERERERRVGAPPQRSKPAQGSVKGARSTVQRDAKRAANAAKRAANAAMRTLAVWRRRVPPPKTAAVAGGWRQRLTQHHLQQRFVARRPQCAAVASRPQCERRPCCRVQQCLPERAERGGAIGPELPGAVANKGERRWAVRAG
eukprot:167662-Prymnesium_polylepis.1